MAAVRSIPRTRVVDHFVVWVHPATMGVETGCFRDMARLRSFHVMRGEVRLLDAHVNLFAQTLTPCLVFYSHSLRVGRICITSTRLRLLCAALTHSLRHSLLARSIVALLSSRCHRSTASHPRTHCHSYSHLPYTSLANRDGPITLKHNASVAVRSTRPMVRMHYQRSIHILLM